jgi:hypothetical protein
MTNFVSSNNDQHLQLSIQQSLQAIALQMGQPLDETAAAQLYQDASGLLSHVAHTPLTLARVAGTLLVYQSPNAEAEESNWFKAQVTQCSNDEEVEELIESIHRIDSL